MLRTTIAPKTAAQRERLLDALTQLADTDPLLRCEVDSITHEIILLGRAVGGCFRFAVGKYKLETVVKEPPSFIWSGCSKQPATPSISRCRPTRFGHP